VSLRDLFDNVADEYAPRRPSYPEVLLDHLEGLVARRELAWDCGAGSDPVEIVRDDLARAWGDSERERLTRWPLHGAIGRVP
jgi:hypothetical protein